MSKYWLHYLVSSVVLSELYLSIRPYHHRARVSSLGWPGSDLPVFPAVLLWLLIVRHRDEEIIHTLFNVYFIDFRFSAYSSTYDFSYISLGLKLCILLLLTLDPWLILMVALLLLSGLYLWHSYPPPLSSSSLQSHPLTSSQVSAFCTQGRHISVVGAQCHR